MDYWRRRKWASFFFLGEHGAPLQITPVTGRQQVDPVVLGRILPGQDTSACLSTRSFL